MTGGGWFTGCALGWAAVWAAVYLTVGAVVALIVGRIIRNGDQQVPLSPGWHVYDRTCECAACQRCEPSSPDAKVPGGADQ